MKKGTKYDGDKLRWDLLPFEQVEKVVDILTYGAKKYEDNNWQGVDKERYVAAAMRHFVAWRKGERCDEESGKQHLAHLATNILFLLYKEDNDDK